MEEQKSLADLTLERERQNEIPDGWREVDGPEGVRVFRRTSDAAMTEDRVPPKCQTWGYYSGRQCVEDEGHEGRHRTEPAVGKDSAGKGASEQPAPPLDVERLVDILDEAEGDGIIGPDYTPQGLAEYILDALGSAPSGSEPEQGGPR